MSANPCVAALAAPLIILAVPDPSSVSSGPPSLSPILPPARPPAAPPMAPPAAAPDAAPAKAPGKPPTAPPKAAPAAGNSGNMAGRAVTALSLLIEHFLELFCCSVSTCSASTLFHPRRVRPPSRAIRNSLKTDTKLIPTNSKLKCLPVESATCTSRLTHHIPIPTRVAPHRIEGSPNSRSSFESPPLGTGHLL